jgi:beta-N-acetylhexosaminidase
LRANGGYLPQSETPRIMTRSNRGFSFLQGQTRARQIGALTLREKIGQTSQEVLSVFRTWHPGDVSELLTCYPVGSLFVGNDVINLQGAESGVAGVIAEFQRQSALPLSVAGDLENGAGHAVKSMTKFPPQLCLGATGSAELAYDFGKYCALEAEVLGFNWTFGPVADLPVNWRNPALVNRMLGDDTPQVMALLARIIRGYQDHGLSATAKHFPGDGVDDRDQHLITSVNSLSKEEWMETFGEIYRACFAQDVHAVMAGHIALPWLDQTVGRGGRPRPATVSPDIMTGLLRDELGFEGVVVSDALIMAGFTGWADWETRTLEAFNAGCDVMLWPGKNYFDLMERAIDDGRVSMERLDQAVTRILRFKEKQGLFGRDFPREVAKEKPLPEAIRFSRQLADAGITLVRNRDNLLPLRANKDKKVLVLAATNNPDQARETLEPFLGELANQGLEVTLKINGNCLDLANVTGKDFDHLIVVYLVSMHQPKNTVRPVGAVAECMWMQQNTSLNPIIVSLGSPYLLHDMPYASTYINAYGDCAEIQTSLARKMLGHGEFRGVSPVRTGGAW